MVRALAPRSLFARVTLIIVGGLAVAQLLTFAEIRHERGVALRELMMLGIERDIGSSVAILDWLPAADRQNWLKRLERRNYHFLLGEAADGPQPGSVQSREFAAAIVNALHPFEVTRVAQAHTPREGVRIQVRLRDGSSVTIDAARKVMPVSSWVLWALAAQLAVLVVCAAYIVRLVTRPLAHLAAAADELGPELKAQRLPENGPTEVAQAARAFNAMQARIAGYMSDRVEILAAISHDLQTPITRMRLRTELMDDDRAQAKFRQDLDSMQALVREGVTYARTLHGTTEPACRIDLDALLDSLVGDYQDVDADVLLEGRADTPIVTPPIALRRIITNLVDNALKFGVDVRVQVGRQPDVLVIAVVDRGPGIPEDQLQAVLKPFYRVESSRNRSTGGTGLGLAIAQQLATAIGARLRVTNRPGGGLEARLDIPRRVTAGTQPHLTASAMPVSP